MIKQEERRETKSEREEMDMRSAHETGAIVKKLFFKKRSLISSNVLLIAICHSTNVCAITLDEIGRLLSDVEVGKEGRCAEAGYKKRNPDPIITYTGKKALLKSQHIGDAREAQVAFAQRILYMPYDGIKMLPNGATLPKFAPPTDNSKIYKITYKSEGKILSGLVVVPDKSISNGIIVYDHATQLSKLTGAPSYPSNEACVVITALTGKDRIIAMPDYVGYGENNGKHPYPLGIENAPSGIDIIVAARELAGEVNKTPIGSGLSVTGYSEGGGNSFWLARKIVEDNPDLMGSQLSMIAPMSGNYDMTGAMAKSLIVRQPVKPIPNIDQSLTFLTKPLLAAYGAQGAQDYSLSSLATMLKLPFLRFVKQNPLPLSSGLLSYGVGLISNAVAGGYTLRDPNPANFMVARFVTAIQVTDTTFPAINLWNNNNNISWVPKDLGGASIPTYVTGILQDEIVPFAGNNYPVPIGYTGGKPFFNDGNSQNLVASLRKKNVESSALAWCGIDARRVLTNISNRTFILRINHLTGLAPVLTLAAKAIESNTLSDLPTIPDPN